MFRPGGLGRAARPEDVDLTMIGRGATFFACWLVCAAVAAQTPAWPPVERRLEIQAGGAALLDAGENARAAAYFERALERYPGLVEAADGLLEARSRLCAPDRALAQAAQGLKSLSGPQHALFKSYLDGARARVERRFEEAAALFASGARAAALAGDSLSAAMCDRAQVQCFLAGQSAPRALEALGKLRGALSTISGAKRLLVEAAALEAEALNLSDELARSDSLYRETLSRARSDGYRRLESACLTGLGRIADKRQRDREAIDLYGGALAIERAMGSSERMAVLLNNVGQVEIRTGALAAAGRHLAESQKLAESCGQKWILGYVYYGRGALAEARGDEKEALEFLRKSLVAHREQNNALGELGAHLRLGYIYSTLGEYTRATAHFEHALKAYEGLSNRYGLSWTLGGLALAYHKLGDFEKAEAYYRRALEIRRELGDEKGAAWCLNSMGMIADMRGRYRDALAYEQEALSISERTGDSLGVASVRYSIGSVYFYLGNYGEALSQYEQAFAIAEKAHDERLLSKIVSGMGSAYSSAGRLDLAENLYERCLALARKLGEESEIVWALNNLGSLCIELKQYGRARVYLGEARARLPETGQDYLRARTLYYLGKTGQTGPAASGYLERALTLAEGSGLEELKWKCLSDLGELALADGDTAQSYALQHRAIVTVESLRRLAGTDELRRHFLEPAILPYERIVSVILGRPGNERDIKEAFSYTERSRAQTLASQLREALDRVGRTGDEKMLQREREILSRLTFYQARLQDGALGPRERTEYLSKIEGLEGRFVNLKLQLERSDKEYAAALYPRVEETDELLSTLAPDECMLSYFLGEERSYVFLGKGRALQVFELSPRADVEQRVENFIALLQQLVDAGGEASNDSSGVAAVEIPRQVFLAASGELYKLLIEPVARHLDSNESLVIIPDGLLHRLPFALLESGGRYLVQDHDIFYAPSLRTLRYLRERNATHGRSNHTPQYNMIAIGCSGEGSSTEGRTPRVYPFTEIPITPLPFAADEAREVAAIFPKALVLTGAAAGESSIKSTPIDDTGILHIAAHAYIDNEDLRRSFIVLNPENGFADSLASPAEDGILQWHEVAALRLNAALVTLAACRSASGILSTGEGMTGLTQAFLYAGGGCVLAAETDVPDKLAGQFMLEFYRRIRDGSNVAAALRSAQLAAIEGTGALAEASAWGAFVAIGDGQSAPTLSRELSPMTSLAFVLLALAATAIVINLFRHRPIF
jgi:CHAT domain-containing protein/tetratricopeptide (TPR) repeat protein